MASTARCSKCGAPVSDEVAGGFCTACLLEEGLAPAGLKEVPTTLKYFGDYELIEEIARGGMGVVFKARQRSLKRIVAVKMILSGHLASETEAQRFRAEARAAAALQHPGIVAIHEVGEHEGLLFFSMDYLEGKNLEQLVRDGPLSAQRAAECVRDIAEAIHYAHEHGVLHRDLKPSNVLLDSSGKPHVTDFGLAKQLNPDSQLSTQDRQLTLSGQVLGSPNFMPPEQAAGKHRELTPASDVYSLGALLYHLLTGRPPFMAEILTQTLRMVAETEPVSPRLLNASVPRDLETICLKCLEKDPTRRYATAQTLADDLNRHLHDEPIHARPIGTVLRLHRWSMRNKALAATGAAVLTLLLVVAIGSPIAAIRINRERQRAEAEAKRNNHIAEFLTAAVSTEILEILEYLQPSIASARPTQELQKALGHTAWELSQLLDNTSRLHEEQGRMAQAEEMLDKALHTQWKLVGTEDNRSGLLGTFVDMLQYQGRFAKLEALYRELLERREKSIPNGWKTFEARSLLGGSIAAQGKCIEAEPLLLSGYEGMKQREDQIPPRLKSLLGHAAFRLVRFYELNGRPEQSAQLKREANQWYREAVAACTKEGGWGDHGLEVGSSDPDLLSSLAWLLATCRDPEVRNGHLAVTMAERAVQMRKNGVRHGFLDTLAAAYAEAGDFEKAIATEKKALALVYDLGFMARMKLYESRTPHREP